MREHLFIAAPLAGKTCAGDLLPPNAAGMAGFATTAGALHALGVDHSAGSWQVAQQARAFQNIPSYHAHGPIFTGRHVTHF
ncbi:hypothetical protein DFR29_10735 [Tahibacter aquaticus]|uniref:Uncharacterized protein n=1 Tax=Tahibacter aquaticus TaxID=520092 RepID=A0A4R6YW94_9GAMM|nr:hypothetical protein [Tahibacter aquaticus]TDR43031.1 hypothetical protein DFR29_10735 [Tahibacter aquaticus]